MMKKFYAITLLLYSQIAWSSDYSGLVVFVYIFTLIPAAIISLIIWLIYKRSGITDKVKFQMALPFLIIASPVPFEKGGGLWPSIGVLLAGDLNRKILIVLTVIVYSFIVFVFIKASSKSKDLALKEKNNNEEKAKKIEDDKTLEKIKAKTKGF